MSISDELAQEANKDVMEDFKKREKVKRASRVVKKGVGKTVACYLSADDVKRLEQAAELLGSSQSGVLHTGILVYLDNLLGTKDAVQAAALAEVVKTFPKEWLKGRLPDPHGTVCKDEKGEPAPTAKDWKAS